ncbi:MAG: DUF6265 family protein [Gilvibacter sp.]
MKYLILFCTIVLVSCKESKEATPNVVEIQQPELANFDWLLGDWQRTNDDQGKQTYEQWAKISDTQYSGLGFTMQANDTVFIEHIQLILKNDVWTFEVTGKDQKTPTVFELITIKDKSFSCKNDENEFPNVIEYTRENNELHAVISGSDMMIPFDFIRSSQNK